MKARELEGNIPPVAIAALLLLATDLAEIALLRSKTPVQRTMAGRARRGKVIQISV
jgi:hypothetical protein